MSEKKNDAVEEIEKTVEDLKKKIVSLSDDENKETDDLQIPAFTRVKEVVKDASEAVKNNDNFQKGLAFIQNNVKIATAKVKEIKDDPSVKQSLQNVSKVTKEALSSASDKVKEIAQDPSVKPHLEKAEKLSREALAKANDFYQQKGKDALQNASNKVMDTVDKVKNSDTFMKLEKTVADTFHNVFKNEGDKK